MSHVVTFIMRFFARRRGFLVLWARQPGPGQPLAPRADDGDPSDGVIDLTDTGEGHPGSGGTQVGGDPEELHELVVDHGDAVFRLAYSIVRDRALAEDVAQETMVKAWLALPTFRGDSSLRGWVMRIAHNTAISMLRTRRALVTDPDDFEEELGSSLGSVERSVEGAVAVDAFVEALDLLDDLSRSIVVLREIEGMSYEDIAQVLDVPLPTIKTRLLRARRRLGTALKEWA